MECYSVNISEIKGRLDPYYYKEEYVDRNKRFSAIAFKTYPLGKLITDISGGATPKLGEGYYTDEKSGVPFLRVQNISEGGLVLDDLKYIKREVHNTLLRRSQLREDDLVFTITGRIGNVAVIPAEFEGNINQHSVRFHLVDKIDGINIIPHYVAIYLNSDFGNILSIRGATGGTRPALDYEFVKSIEIPIPSVEIQNQVVDIMKSAYHLKEQKESEAKKLLDSIDEYILGKLGVTFVSDRAEFCYAVDFNSVEARLDPHFYRPEFKDIKDKLLNLDSKRLDEVITLSNETWNQQSIFNEQFPYIEIGEIDLVTGEVKNIQNYDIKEAPSRARMIVRENDIIVSTTRPNRGAINLIDKSKDGFIASTGFAVLRQLKSKQVDREYLFYLLRTQLCLMQMLQRSSGGNYPAITSEELKNILIPIPAIDIQKEIATEVRSRIGKLKELQREAQNILKKAKTEVEKIILG